MNILQPEIVLIGKRRYRRNPFRLSFPDSNTKLEPYREDNDQDYITDEPCDQITCKLKDSNEYEDIHAAGEDNFKLNMLVNETYFGYIIGRNGEKKNKLEIETKTKIKIPKRGQSADWLVIEGKEKANIDSCRNRILIIINSARHQKPFTHLITFPLTFINLKNKFNEFKRIVLDKCQYDTGVDDSLFQNTNKLHLTITTAVLVGENEIDQAVNILNECRNSFVKSNKPLKVNIKGLEYMNDDPQKVDILYAQVKPVDQIDSNPLQLIADNIMNSFVLSGLGKKQYDKVKLHVTVMNSLMRQDPSGSTEPMRGDKNDQREPFDARNILKNFGDYDFGIYDLNDIHLSLRYSTARDGFYECVCKINLT